MLSFLFWATFSELLEFLVLGPFWYIFLHDRWRCVGTSPLVGADWIKHLLTLPVWCWTSAWTLQVFLDYSRKNVSKTDSWRRFHPFLVSHSVCYRMWGVVCDQVRSQHWIMNLLISLNDWWIHQHGLGSLTCSSPIFACHTCTILTMINKICLHDAITHSI